MAIGSMLVFVHLSCAICKKRVLIQTREMIHLQKNSKNGSYIHLDTMGVRCSECAREDFGDVEVEVPKGYFGNAEV